MSPTSIRIAAWLLAHSHHGHSRPRGRVARPCPSSGWPVREACVRRDGADITCRCPTCSALVDVEHVPVGACIGEHSDARLPVHAMAPAVTAIRVVDR